MKVDLYRCGKWHRVVKVNGFFWHWAWFRVYCTRGDDDYEYEYVGSLENECFGLDSLDHALSCIQLCKRLSGIKKWWVQLPSQLDREFS